MNPMSYINMYLANFPFLTNPSLQTNAPQYSWENQRNVIPLYSTLWVHFGSGTIQHLHVFMFHVFYIISNLNLPTSKCPQIIHHPRPGWAAQDISLPRPPWLRPSRSRSDTAWPCQDPQRIARWNTRRCPCPRPSSPQWLGMWEEKLRLIG